MKRFFFLGLLLSFLSLGLASDTKILSFKHPDKSSTIISLPASDFTEFKEEWKGKHYYYISQSSQSGIVCSLFFYYLSEAEQKALLTMREKFAVPKTSPAFPFTYYTTSSKVSKDEKNTFEWGTVDGDFMFRHADIEEMGGSKIHQKNMFAYAMIGDDMFATVHLSKILCTPQDSVAMRSMLQAITLKR